ncbi:MAG: hypothetical protein RL671_493 [Pseudomonadota bacterium]
MISTEQIAAVAVLLASLFLVSRNFRSAGLSFNRAAMMAVIWVIFFAMVAWIVSISAL